MSHNPHLLPDQLHRYASDPSGVDPVGASSIEAHLVGCASCRASLNTAVDRQFLRASWEAVADRVDQPNRSVFERFLLRAGVSDSSARLLAATPTLRVAATTALVLVIVAAMVAPRTPGLSAHLLALAPLVPLGVVALAFATTTEPVGEVAIATPIHGLALVVRRSVVVAVVAFAALGAVDVAAGGSEVPRAVWVLPSFALTAGVLALATWVRVEVATVALAGGWIAIVWPIRLIVDRRADVGASVAFAIEGQIVALCIGLVCIAVLWVRRDRFDSVEVFS